MAAEGVSSVGSSTRVAERAFHRLVLVLAPPWIAAMVLGVLEDDSPWSMPLVLGCAAALSAGYAWFLLVRPRRPARLLYPLIATSVTVALAVPPGLPVQGDPLYATWLFLACVSIAALVPGWRGIGLGLGVVVAVLGLVAGRLLTLGESVPVSVLGSAALWGVTDLVVVSLAGGVLRRTAAHADAAADALARTSAQTSLAVAGREEQRRVARLLHDTVVNTLGAISRWRQRDVAAVQRRCAEDLALLTEAEVDRTRDPSEVLESVRRRGDLLGLQVSVAVESLGPELGECVASALEGACWEALNNVAKHSGVSQADLTWSWDGSRGRVVIDDQGAGFDPDGVPIRSPAASMAERCAGLRLQASARTAPGRGTSITLTWQADPDESASDAGPSAADAADVDLETIMAGVFLRVAGVLGTSGVLVLWAMPMGAPLWGTVAAIAITAFLAVAAIVAGRRGRGLRLPILTYPLLGALGAWLPSVGAVGCERVSMWWWGPLGGIVVAAAAALLDRRPVVVGLTMLGYAVGNGLAIIEAGGGTCAQTAWGVLLLDLGVILGITAFARRLEQTWALGRREHDLMVAERRKRAAATATMRARRELLGFAQAVAEPVLSGLASGELDPLDPDVRHRCGQVEVTLRALAHLPVGDPGGSGEALGDLVVAAHERGVHVVLRLGSSAPYPPEVSAWIRRLVPVLLPVTRPQGALELTVLRLDGRFSAMALVRGPDPQGVPALEDVGWSVSALGDELLAEATWVLEGDAASGGAAGGSGTTVPRVTAG